MLDQDRIEVLLMLTGLILISALCGLVLVIAALIKLIW